MRKEFGGAGAEMGQEAPAPSPYLKLRETYHEKGDPVRAATMDVQGAKYEVALHKLMERSDDDPELVNAMNAFLDRLNAVAALGRPEEKLGTGRAVALKALFEEAKTKLDAIQG